VKDGWTGSVQSYSNIIHNDGSWKAECQAKVDGKKREAYYDPSSVCTKDDL